MNLTPEQVKQIVETALKEGLGFHWWAYVIALLVALLGSFFSAYTKRKAENLATREDIKDITDKIEDVRTQYATLIEELKARHQLRLAAVDRRLQVHQEAFTHWRKLVAATYTDEVGTVVIECQAWWEQNCIYLEPTVRESFVRAYRAASDHNQLVQMREQAAIIKNNWSLITEFPDILFQAVQLPALSELEAKVLGIKNEPDV